MKIRYFFLFCFAFVYFVCSPATAWQDDSVDFPVKMYQRPGECALDAEDIVHVDVDGDADLDLLVVAGWTSEFGLTVWLNDGNGDFVNGGSHDLEVPWGE